MSMPLLGHLNLAVWLVKATDSLLDQGFRSSNLQLSTGGEQGLVAVVRERRLGIIAKALFQIGPASQRGSPFRWRWAKASSSSGQLASLGVFRVMAKQASRPRVFPVGVVVGKRS